MLNAINQPNAGSRNYAVVGGSHVPQSQKEPLKLVNVYANVQQKRQAARNMLNKKASEEKMISNNILYQNKKPMEQRYKSHLRGQDVPSSMIRNQSKPTLQLPEIHSTQMQNQNAVLSRNDISSQILNSNRSKKSLGHMHHNSQLPSPHGYIMPGINSNEAKIKGYYDIRQKAGQGYGNDISKIYMMQGQNDLVLNGSGSQQQLQYQKRMNVAHSPSNAEMLVGGIPMPGGYFHQRNQSQDVGSLSSVKPSALKNKLNTQRKRGVLDENAGEYIIE